MNLTANNCSDTKVQEKGAERLLSLYAGLREELVEARKLSRDYIKEESEEGAKRANRLLEAHFRLRRFLKGLTAEELQALGISQKP